MKHLICLFDGTWNSAASGRYEDITNVYRLNLAISRANRLGQPQIVFYIPGPGNRGRFDRELGGLFGQGLDQIIREAYVCLSSNYVTGDMIYLFGFSRGAVAARALVSLITESGLLLPLHLHRLHYAWKRYVNVNLGKEKHRDLEDLASFVHPDVTIEMLGLFDSVLGRRTEISGRSTELVFANYQMSRIVTKGINIVSIDDNRLRFKPMPLEGAADRTEQIWMPGVHGDVGGVGKPTFIGIVSLLTMIAEIKLNTKLTINSSYVGQLKNQLHSMDDIIVSNERSGSLMKLFRHHQRSPCSSSDKRHYLFDLLLGMTISVRGRWLRYDPATKHKIAGLPQWEDEYVPDVKHCLKDNPGRRDI